MPMPMEHANITVRDVDREIEFLRVAFPHFRIRGEGKFTIDGLTLRWVHVGDDERYVCVNQGGPDCHDSEKMYKRVGINHVGYLVESLDAVRARLAGAGHKSAAVEEPPARRRVYVDDGQGITWEFLEYLSDDPAVRNDYSI